ncbi:response regulator [Desertivirga xinjiangensis]|uniref:response regulator n=1 Tax=Desertivirga xinjiangensis TaxID=539206 RepID=UPI00210AA902|nr:response regulator [Pedobacter xinjiangensis]
MTKYKDLNCILLIDDDLATNFLHRKVVQTTGIEVHVQTTTSGRDALDFLCELSAYQNTPEIPRPGIIFLDINMPEMNGWEFLEEYDKLKDEQKAEIVVVMLTTSLNPDDEARAFSNKNITTFLNKPLKPEVLEELAEKFFTTK